MKKLILVLSNAKRLIETLQIIVKNYDPLKEAEILGLRTEIENHKIELANLKTRISFYRASFLNDHDYRNQFINEFPQLWHNIKIVPTGDTVKK